MVEYRRYSQYTSDNKITKDNRKMYFFSQSIFEIPIVNILKVNTYLLKKTLIKGA